MKKPSRNLWPVGLIVTFALFISGTIGLVIMACAHGTELVSPDYYEQEIKFQGRLDSLNRARPLTVSVLYEATQRRLQIRLPQEHAGQAITGSIQLYRPSAAGLDLRFVLRPDAKGAQSLDATSLRPGLWKVRVAWKTGGREYFHDQSVIISSANAHAERGALDVAKRMECVELAPALECRGCAKAGASSTHSIRFATWFTPKKV